MDQKDRAGFIRRQKSLSYGYSSGMAVYGLLYEDLKALLVEDLKIRQRAAHGTSERAYGQRRCSDKLTRLLAIANAFLMTGDEKYKRWLLEYVDAWIERAARYDGFLPDNGPVCEVGEYVESTVACMDGPPHGFYNIAMAAILAGIECFFTGEKKYLSRLATRFAR